MQTVRVSDLIQGYTTTLLLSLEAGEDLFYELVELVHLEDIYLEFAWREAYYSSEFFAVLFDCILSDPDYTYLSAMLRRSDLFQDAELARLCEIAWSRLGLWTEVLT